MSDERHLEPVPGGPREETETDRAHREDYALKRACDDARRALDLVRDLSGRRFSSSNLLVLEQAGELCQATSDQIVRVWD